MLDTVSVGSEDNTQDSRRDFGCIGDPVRVQESEVWKNFLPYSNMTDFDSFWPISDTCKFHLGNDVVQCQLDIVPIKNENGSVVFFLVSVKDISKDGGLGGSVLNSINFTTAPASHRPSIGLIDTTRNWRRRSRAVLYNLPKNIGLGRENSGNTMAMGDGQFIKNALGKSVLPIATWVKVSDDDDHQQSTPQNGFSIINLISWPHTGSLLDSYIISL